MGSRSKSRSIATVTSKGQITIPREVRRALRIQTGTQLSFEVEGGRAVMAPQDGDISALFAIVPRKPGSPRMSLDDMEAAIRRGATRGRR